MGGGRRGDGEGRIEVVGLHPYPVSDELLHEALELKYPLESMSPDEIAEAENAVRFELGSLYVVDILVEDPNSILDLVDLAQPGSDQAPYEEVWLDDEIAAGDWTSRIAFFLHDVDPGAGLDTPFGHVPFPVPTPLPERLAVRMEYAPVD